MANFGTFDVGNPQIPKMYSSITLGYISQTDVFPGWSGRISDHPADILLAFTGDPGVLSDVADLLNQNTWDHLTKYRELAVTFGYFAQSDFKYVTVYANVGQVSIIAEPSSTFLSAAGLALMAVRWRRAW